MNRWRQFLSELKRYPSAIAGSLLILALIGLALYAMAAIPYQEALRLWRGGDTVWLENPRNARPVWTNLFSSEQQPTTTVLRSTDEPDYKTMVDLGDGIKVVDLVFPLEYHFDGFPREMSLFFRADYEDMRPSVSLSWHTPDGRVIPLTELSLRTEENYRISQDERLIRRLRGQAPEVGLFADPNASELQPLQGTYQLVVEGLVFEADADFEAVFINYGQVHGLAGTDHRRRDLTVALLWGTPIALSFGLLAAVGSTLTTMFLAAVGIWFGGWMDAAIRRMTEIVLILPVLPILIMIGIFYSRSIWVMLGAIILLGIFGSGIMTYRAMFLQVRESSYIEAARAYGAGNFRIIFRYMIPRVIPVLVPQFVTLIPTYVFLEASLAVLGLGDPVLPTWGKLLNDAYANGALFRGYYYWVLQPAVLLMVTGLGFAMLGFALDRIFNPRLRGL